MQLLWQQIQPDHNNLYNGLIIALLTLFGGISAFAVGACNSEYFEKLDFWLVAGCSFLQGTFLLCAVYADNIVVAYISYILYGVFYYSLITLAR